MVEEMKPIFIAEIKTQSPFGYKSTYPFVSLMRHAIKYGDWVSVHTNALWGGDYDAISFVRKNTTKPILAKGIHGTNDDVNRAFDHGADYVLVVDRYPSSSSINSLTEDRKRRILHEMDFQHVKGNVEFSSHWAGVKYVCNSRDLKTGLPKMKWELDDFIKLGVWTCQASGIKSPEQVDQRAKAFIVGEHLIEFCEKL